MSAGGREAWANDLSYAYAAGGMLSTAEDLVRFGVALNHARLVNRGSIARMYETLLDPVMRYEEGGAPSRMDFQQGFNAHLVIFPDDDVVASILYNSDDLPPSPPGQPKLVPDDQLGVVVLASPFLPARATGPDR